MRLRSLAVALLALVTIPPAAARFGMPEPLTERGQIIGDLYNTLFILGMIVFLIVMALMAYVMWTFRAKGGAGRETFEVERENLKLEMAWIVIPLIVVLWVGVISYAGLIELDEGHKAEDADLEILITGYQWNWEADYGSGVDVFSDPSGTDGSVSDDKVFKVPADKVIYFNVTGADVIHAFHLMDENWATVGLVDANPYGPHKYNGFTAVLPEGEYRVQCREMCFNPGHGYMRARIQAVPMAEFGDWMEEKAIGAGAGLLQEAAVTFDGGFGDQNLTLVAGENSRAVVTFQNDGADTTVSVPGFSLQRAVFDEASMSVDIVDVDSVPVASGQSVTFAFDVGEETGSFSLEADDASMPVRVIEATPVDVVMGDLFIQQDDIQIEQGKTYLFRVENQGDLIHNFYIGSKSETVSDPVAASPNIPGGSSGTFVFTATDAGTFDTWCDITGHWPKMQGQLTVE